MRRSTLGPVSQNSLNSRSAAPGGHAVRNPNMSMKPIDDRRASAFPSVGERRSTLNSTGSARLSSRPSSLYGGAGRGLRQDPRPLNDRHFLQGCVRTLIDFLVNRGYELPLSNQILSSPSAKDFQSIFLFLIHRIDPTFAFQRRFEDEVPIVLKCLRYPFSVSKSALSAVGSPHTMPTLLGVLSWLAGLITYDEERQTFEENLELETPDQRDKFFNKTACDAYREFMCGADEHPQLDESIEEYFREERKARETEVEKLQSDIEQLKATLNELQTQPSPLSLAKQHYDVLETNVKKFNLLIPSLREHCSSVEKKISEKQAEVDKDQRELEWIREEKKSLAHILEQQEEAAIDAERIAEDREKLKKSLEARRVEHAEVESQQKAQESLLMKSAELLQQKLVEYHIKMDKLGFTPSSEKPAGAPDVDCSISISRNAELTESDEILSMNPSRHTVPYIEQYKVQIAEEVRSLKEKSLSLEEAVDEVEGRLVLVRQQLDINEARKKKREDELESRKAALHNAAKERSEAILTKEGEMDDHRKELEEKILEAEKRTAMLTDQHQSFKEQFVREVARLEGVVGDQINELLSAQQRAREAVGWVKEYFDNFERKSRGNPVQ